jgi:ABC-type amino acid transport substrate-binding protein
MRSRGVVAALALLLMACVLLVPQALPGAPKVPLKVLRVGADPDFRPITFADKSGKLIGYDVDFATELASRLGIPLDYQGVAWDGIIPALTGGKIDSITDMVITDKRKEVVAFSQPYMEQTITTVVRADKPGFNPGRNDLAALKVGVQVNTSAAGALEKIPGVKPTTYNTVADEFNDLVLGRIDVVAMESLGAGYTTKELYKGKLRVTGQKLTDEPALIGAAFRKEDTALVDAANEVIRAMIKDGALERINKKWFGDIKLIPSM